MYKSQLARASWISLCLLMSAMTSFSQTSASSVPSATPSPTPSTQQIVYTGKHIGYLRIPSQQRGTAYGCSTPSSAHDSKAATKFLKKRTEYKLDKAVLVGTGDNFAPQLEARVFDPKPPLDSLDLKPGEYQPGNKELYYWYESKSRWVFYRNPPKDLQRLVADGMGTIPNDNVGCFLAAAGYSAVIPGKHDFYYGAERVRQLARFMAGLPRKDGAGPPQMLGANLVIKTERLEEPATASDERKFEWPGELSVLNLRDKKSVYPWFSSVRVRLMEFKPESELPNALKLLFPKEGSTTEPDFLKLLDRVPKPISADDQDKLLKLQTMAKQFSQDPVYVCRSGRDPNDITPGEACRIKNRDREVHLSGNNVVYDLPLDPVVTRGKNEHFSTLLPGASYGFCVVRQETVTKPNGKTATEQKDYCLRFSVHTPFFQSPRPVASTGTDYTDPDPFVFLKKSETRPHEVAIFGIVDPSIGEHVGVLNFSWLNQDEKFKTVLSAEDPVQALTEQLAYFKRWYKGEDGKPFAGLKILLAQVSPQRARVLAARFPEFHVVVTAADKEQATSETDLRTVWSPGSRAAAFVAVPAPYYDAEKKDLEGSVHFGVINASWEEASKPKESWTLRADVKEAAPVPKPIKVLPATGLSCKPSTDKQSTDPKQIRDLVASGLCRCLPADFESPELDQYERIKWLTLCAMREQAGADVALIQKRDLFNAFPTDDADHRMQAQQILDRIIWKGDLFTLLYVPGSAIKKALDQSATYETEDSNLLSLADEKWRKLETLGVTYIKEKKEYWINEAPIDDKRLYAVATTDYLGAGDTGYPAFAASALNPRRHPTEFPKRLEPISSIVCRKLFSNPADADRYCLAGLERDVYLDESAALPAPALKQKSVGSKLWDLVPFKWPGKTTFTSLEQQVQHRPIWTWSLRNLSLGFSRLDNNLTDTQIDERFAGVSTSRVNSKRKLTATFGLDMRISRSTHQREVFLALGADYKKETSGDDSNADNSEKIVQSNNRVTGDVGVIFNLKGGRSKERLGLAVSLRGETSVERPFGLFFLATKTPVNDTEVTDRLRISQRRSLTLLPRVGLRWQHGLNSFEIGGQAGREFRALAGYQFNTQGVIANCPLSAEKKVADCIKEKSKPPNATITKGSDAQALLHNRPRAGFYSNWSFSLQLGRAKYETSGEADFFAKFGQDNETDTRYRVFWKHALKFPILPSLSIGPSIDFFRYLNKLDSDLVSELDRKPLFQTQAGFEATFTFDLFNRREKSVQIKYKSQ